MALFTIPPTRTDVTIARTVARWAKPAPEQIARAVTWGADEKILLALATVGWPCTRSRDASTRRAADHILTVSIVTSLLPHLVKHAVDQTRPDRLTVVGHLHGIALSGRRRDAFPSGHAVHMGALASAASILPPVARRTVRGLAIGLSLTRVLVLAHWASDVLVGFAAGFAIERLLRYGTKTPSTAGDVHIRNCHR